MAVNSATLDLIKSFEGWRASAYPDPATGGEPITIGYGHTLSAGPPKPVIGMRITREEGEVILRRDLIGYENSVKSLVKVPLDENQFGALVSFTYNLGAGNLGKSTLLKKLNASDYAGAAAEFLKWDKAGGRTLSGLTRRRKAEKALFLTPVKPTSGTAAPQTTKPAPRASKQPAMAIAVAVLVALALLAFFILKG